MGDEDPQKVLALMQEYKISARLTQQFTFEEEHLQDRKCNALCELFEKQMEVENGVILHSELLLNYLQNTYPELLFCLFDNKSSD